MSGIQADEANPANTSAPDAGARRRIPMSVPMRKLEVSPIPGYSLYWFLQQNVPRAQQAGYEFVQANEVTLNQQNVASSKDISGNADLGGQVKVISGSGVEGAEHLVLMKIRLEWYNEDRRLIEEQNAKVLASIFRGETILGTDQVNPGDRDQMYVKQALMQRPTRK